MGKKKLAITLYMSELVYDFQNKAFLTGRSRKTDATAELASNMQASDDEEDLNQTLRSIQGAYGTLLSALSDGLYGGFVEDGPTTAKSENKSEAKSEAKAGAGAEGTGAAADTKDEDTAEADGAKSESADNELLGATADLTLTLHVPSNFVMTLKSTIATYMHDYVVNMALCDWLQITDKADAADYGAKAQAALEGLRQTLCRRERPRRKGVA